MELALALPNKQGNKFYRAQGIQKQSSPASQQREEYWQIYACINEKISSTPLKKDKCPK